MHDIHRQLMVKMVLLLMLVALMLVALMLLLPDYWHPCSNLSPAIFFVNTEFVNRDSFKVTGSSVGAP